MVFISPSNLSTLDKAMDPITIATNTKTPTSKIHPHKGIFRKPDVCGGGVLVVVTCAGRGVCGGVVGSGLAGVFPTGAVIGVWGESGGVGCIVDWLTMILL